MTRFGFRVLALFALMAGVAFVANNDMTAQEKKEEKKKKGGEPKFETVKACMACQQKSAKALPGLVKDGKWDDAASTVKTWGTAASALGGLKPKKGDEDSWKKLTAKYVDDVKAISTGIEKKDAEATAKALKTFSASCGACHEQHK